jgi:hypothetical protein
MKVVLIFVALVAARVLLYPFLRQLIAMVFVRIGVKGALEDVGSKALVSVPDRISLVHQNLHSWNPDPAVARLADSLFSKGYQESGLYAIREMPGVIVRFLVKPAECIVAAIFMHPKAGTWLDLITYYQNGNSATFSTNAPKGLDPRPGHPIVYAPGATPATLHAKLTAERPKGVFRPVMTEDVGPLFERAYAESVAWRKHKGLSAAEVVKVAERKAG